MDVTIHLTDVTLPPLFTGEGWGEVKIILFVLFFYVILILDLHERGITNYDRN